MNVNDTTETVTLDAASRASMLSKIEKLLTKADDQAATPAEAEAFRAKAEQLMAKYRIAEEEARDRGDVDATTPIIVDIVVCSQDSDFYQSYYNLAAYAVGHTGCRMTYAWASVEGVRSLVAKVAGYDMDVRYCQMLFLAAKLQFQAHLEPSLIEGESESMTAYRFRNAGKTRREVAVMLWGREVEHSVAAHQKVQKWYEAEAERQGHAIVRGRGVVRADYVKTYAESFTSRFSQRLRTARNAADSVGGQLVWAKRKDAVEDAFYAAFPNLRPKQDVEPAAAYEDTRTDAQKKRDQARWDREYEKGMARRRSAAGRAGWDAGTASADAVALSGVEPARRIEE
jgi:ElaB/YqjD/DUF883 family membrane-anchored ribosome-binding protein